MYIKSLSIPFLGVKLSQVESSCGEDREEGKFQKSLIDRLVTKSMIVLTNNLTGYNAKI